MLEYIVWAYVILVKSGGYILDEAQRKNEKQVLIPEKFKLAVAQKIITE